MTGNSQGPYVIQDRTQRILDHMDAQQLITARNAILDRMTAFFLLKKDVLGFFVAGSLANSTADEYSDIDFRVVVESKHFEVFTAGHMAYPREWGDFVCNNGGPNVSVSHFRPFNKVDVFYYRPEDLKPSPFLSLPIRILHDPHGIIRGLLDASKGLSFRPTPKDVSNSISVAIGSAHEVYRRARRGELLYAQAILDSFRGNIIEADDALHGRALSGQFAFSHAEGRLDTQLLRALRDSHVPTEAGAILASLRTLAAIYKEKATALHKEYALDRELATDIADLAVVFSN